MSSHRLDSLISELRASLLSENIRKVFVGFSGGVDSRLLLEIAVKALGSDNVVALHVNHNMSPNAEEWEQFCRAEAQQLKCGFLSREVVVDNQGLGLESEAREQRYRFFDSELPQDSVLLLGHHLDDQVETFFLRLMRGAGPRSLSAMRTWSDRHHYRIFRPLLVLSKLEIIEAANEAGFSWVEDESNETSVQDRNFLRNEVLPLLESRWPAYRNRIHQVQGFLEQSDSEQFPDIERELVHRLSHDGGLKMVELKDWSRKQKLSLLHYWLSSLSIQVPSKARLEQILDTVVAAKRDANPVVMMSNGSVRRHGPALYWVPEFETIGTPPLIAKDEKAYWSGVGHVGLVPTSDEIGLKVDLPDLHWRLRAGGEKIRPFGRSKSRDLKRVMQEYRLKPWLRDRIPLLFSGDALIAVGDEILSADHLATDEQPKMRVIWQYD